MKTLNKILIYISIICVLIYLCSIEQISLPNIISYGNLINSFIFLILGFLLQAKVWQNLLIVKAKCKSCDFKFALISEYLSIFSKYIPGKIWTIVGPSLYVSTNKNIELKLVTYVATFFQVLIIWTGIVISSTGLKDYLNIYEYSIVISGAILLSAFFLYEKLFIILSYVLNKVVKLELEFIPIRNYFISIVYLFFQWIAWGFGFFLLIDSFYDIQFSFNIFMIFPLAATLGLLAIITPGGLGVREGVIVFLLMKNGILFEEATAISILSRLWFLVGEIFIFLTVSYLKNNLGKRK